MSSKPATYLEVGMRNKADTATYSDVDMVAVTDDGKWRFETREGRNFWTSLTFDGTIESETKLREDQ